MKLRALRLIAVIVTAWVVSSVAVHAGTFAFDADSLTASSFAGLRSSDVAVRLDRPGVVPISIPGSSVLVNQSVRCAAAIPPSEVGSFDFDGTVGQFLIGSPLAGVRPSSNPAGDGDNELFAFRGAASLSDGAPYRSKLTSLVDMDDPVSGVSSIVWSGEMSLVPEPKAYGWIMALGLIGFGGWRRLRG